jgi:hypothetical protein
VQVGQCMPLYCVCLFRNCHFVMEFILAVSQFELSLTRLRKHFRNKDTPHELSLLDTFFYCNCCL